MLALTTNGFGALWSILTSTSVNRPVSPVGHAPKLVYLRKSSESLTQQNWSYNSISSDSISSLEQKSHSRSSDSSLETTTPTKLKPKPRRRRLSGLMCHLKPSSQSSRYTKINPKPRPTRKSSQHESLAHHCTLCSREIPPTHFYASRPRKILQDNTYISTRCCHSTVHSPCYRITLQYFIDSKGRPRCPICRDYPDLFVACWALGYVFDKDVGDGEEEECDCRDDMGVWCDVCQGRKMLLRDLAGVYGHGHGHGTGEVVVDSGLGLGADRCVEKGVRLFTIIEGEEEDM